MTWHFNASPRRVCFRYVVKDFLSSLNHQPILAAAGWKYRGIRLTMEDSQPESQDVALETPAPDVFIAPSISTAKILSGESYAYYSSIPEIIANEMSTECVLGVDEAGRGPVLGIN